MLVRTDPFRDLDRLTQQVFGTSVRPAVMAMDAWREGDTFVVEFDLPGVGPAGVDLDTEQVSAAYDNGVLRLQIPVAEKAKPRKITVHRSAREPQAIRA